MIYTTFEQIEYGFVLFNNFKKHSDINRRLTIHYGLKIGFPVPLDRFC